VTAVRLDVEGLAELRRELKKLEDAKEFEAELKDVNKRVGDLVVAGARAHASTPMERAAAASLRSSRAASKAQVLGGSARVPFFGGAEFGAMQNQMRVSVRGPYEGLNQFHPWKGNGRDAGYFLYPAIRAAEAEIVDMYGEGLEAITARAFPK
jgi:hypothetical protein